MSALAVDSMQGLPHNLPKNYKWNPSCARDASGEANAYRAEYFSERLDNNA